jgi:hypothetical protein
VCVCVCVCVRFVLTCLLTRLLQLANTAVELLGLSADACSLSGA